MADTFFPLSVPLELTEQAVTPSTNPVSGALALYAKTDDKLYTLTTAGVETQVGSGSSGGRTFAFFAS